MAVILGNVVSGTTVTDTASLQLQGAFGVTTLVIGGVTYVYALGLNEDGINVFELGSDGSLTPVQSIHDSSSSALKLNGAANFTSATVDGTTYLYAFGSLDDGISTFRVSEDGTLTNIQNISDTTVLELNGAEGKMTVAEVGGTRFVVATGDDDNGISVFRINADGTLTNTDNVTDSGVLELDNAMDVVDVDVAGHTYLFVAGEDDNGLAGFELHANGTVTSTYNLTDNATVNLWGASGLTSAEVGGIDYLVASGGYDDGLSVFQVNANGTLTNVFNIQDDATLGLNGAQGLTTFTLDGETFILVSARDDDALSVFHMGAGGVLSDVTAVFDAPGLALNETHYSTVANVDGQTVLIGTGFLDNGLSTFTLGAGNDGLTGTSSADLLLGLAGDDRLNGAGGDDTLHGDSGNDAIDGGAGVDEAVFSGKAEIYQIVQNADGTVTVTDLRTGSPDGTDTLTTVERLRFADAVLGPDGTPVANSAPTDILVDGDSVKEDAPSGTVVAQLGAVDRDPGETFAYTLSDPSGTFVLAGDQIRVAAGAQIDYEVRASYSVTVTVTDSAGNTFQEDALIRVERSFNSIFGTTAADTLTGTAGADEIWGRSGNDSLSGLGGSDSLYGEAGADRLNGGAGANTLVGGIGNDTYIVGSATDILVEVAGEGTDTVRTSLASLSLVSADNVEHLTYEGSGSFHGVGNALNNMLTGGNGADSLHGGAGNDILKGLLGADTLEGGAGLDDFVYATVKNSLPGAGQDHILGFTSGEDDIVLTGIDANVSLSGNQAFVLDVDGSFSAGEIRQTLSGGNLLLEMNVDKDATPEMAILLEGNTAKLLASDFDL